MLHSFRRFITEIGMMDVGPIWSDILFTSHAVASRGSTRKGAHLMKRSSYREQDYAFGQLMLTLRTRIGLTQAGVADLLGVSRRAVAEWEARSEEHTSELQSHLNLVCRLLLEKKKQYR